MNVHGATLTSGEVCSPVFCLTFVLRISFGSKPALHVFLSVPKMKFLDDCILG